MNYQLPENESTIHYFRKRFCDAGWMSLHIDCTH